MIPKETIAQIFETARVEEVVGDYVHLKKKGANLWGNCPFHNEKTPSFSVSPPKGIYKCFGCGKGGNSVNFMMDHEQMTYPEALRHLAKRYNIEIAEEEQTPEQIAENTARESLLLVLGFGQKTFTTNLLKTEEGQAIGLSYFKERGFSQETIEKFDLGYCFDRYDSFGNKALEAQYNRKFLVDSGLCIERENKLLDRFKGRVMFPIHNLSGRVIAFGGRTLRNDKKVAKYINSPETDVYHKSKIVYGIYQAKSEIIKKDNCFVVEG
ncbi:MAG: DNA primase, partial [Flavobacteriales bacterium]